MTGFLFSHFYFYHMEIAHEENKDGGRFYIDEDNNNVAEMTYHKLRDNVIMINHTWVSDTLKGKGAGKQLVSKGVEYARKNNLKVIPRCSFAKTLFDKITEFQDVLDK